MKNVVDSQLKKIVKLQNENSDLLQRIPQGQTKRTSQDGLIE